MALLVLQSASAGTRVVTANLGDGQNGTIPDLVASFDDSVAPRGWYGAGCRLPTTSSQGRRLSLGCQWARGSF